MNSLLMTSELGKKYRRKWALSDCSISIPAGRVVGLVGPNGAGKTTLLQLAVGLIEPTTGAVEVLGARPGSSPDALARIGYVAQESPIYSRLTIDEHLRMGALLNAHWDVDFAKDRIKALGLDPHQRAGSLSGGQRSQLALTLAVGKRPEFLILDEPVAALDPLARREFLQTLMEVVAVNHVSVLLSSHLITDLERVCDYLVVLIGGRVVVEGDIEELKASHHRIVGPHRKATELPTSLTVIEGTQSDKQSTFIVRADGPILDPSWMSTPVSLDDLVLAYMKQARDGQVETNRLALAQ